MILLTAVIHSVPLISTIKEIAITSELMWIYRRNQLLQRLKTGNFVTLCCDMASISGMRNVQPVFNLDLMCYEPSVVWHCWQQHKFFLVSLPNHILVFCRSVLNKLPQENQVGSTTLCPYCLHILIRTIPCKMDWKRITIHDMACQITRSNTT